jgi:hypothetical protein
MTPGRLKVGGDEVFVKDTMARFAAVVDVGSDLARDRTAPTARAMQGAADDALLVVTEA